ncbi:MAG: hypothetical protein UZ20_WS6002000085 [candidate division WS6 bacterium OLB21]|uniref:Uncharacterized protein n=1 Tax=candidate division WS6 bacterium OLB21 TaxID=1617427 RepID=A0A136KKR6_9BACT|nr:MAG: hypothetical protein UZ20_WS6002000085 [candidate division WS6 bacterium OLB21]
MNYGFYIPDQLIDKEIKELDLSMITFDQIARYSRELPVCTDETIEKNKIFPICREELTAPGQQLIQNQITSYLDTLQSSNYNNNKVFSTILNYPRSYFGSVFSANSRCATRRN